MNVFDSYNEAYDFAVTCAREYGHDQGIGVYNEYGTRRYKVVFLPKQEKCFGAERRMERITPDCPRRLS